MGPRGNTKIYAAADKSRHRRQDQLHTHRFDLLKPEDTHPRRRSHDPQVKHRFTLGPPGEVKCGTKSQGASDRGDDLVFVKRVLGGDENAARALRARYDALLKSTLCKRGATSTEAEDLLADLWADCFGSSGKRLLQKYEGRCPLSSWLNTVATNRLIDAKRRQSFRGDLRAEELNQCAANDLELMGSLSESRPDEEILALLRQAVVNAFAAESPERMLMLRLVHIYKITQREIGRMWSWHESKVSRTLESAHTKIKTAVLMELRRTDPWLTLEWSDFLELARCAPDIVSRGGSEIEVQDSTIHES